MKDSKASFYEVAEAAQNGVSEAVTAYLTSVCATLDLVRSESASLESERDPVFRDQISETVRLSTEETRRIAGILSELRGL